MIEFLMLDLRKDIDVYPSNTDMYFELYQNSCITDLRKQLHLSR